MKTEKTFPIALHVRAKHGVLAAALKKRGWNQSQAAKFLGITPTEFGWFINMQKQPKRPSRELVQKLYDLTGLLMEEIWPREVFTEEFLATPKTAQLFKDIPTYLFPELVELRALPFATPEEQYEQTELQEMLNEAMKILSPRERKVVEDRIFNDKTLDEVAAEIGKTSERVRQIQARALSKLRTPRAETLEIERLAKRRSY